ncbi:apolipoprotein N-acyltransferase [Shimia sp.]|uniref:apolipoprotein N-acyltransferase n=1 Tax=Shimia sp. TaxID=1954381 RepID=UPI00329A55FC
MAETEGRRRAVAGHWRVRLLMLLSGVLAALGHPPLDLSVLTFFGFGVAFWCLHKCATPRHALWLGLAFGTGYFAVAIHWIVEPFLVDPVRHGWMAPFALVFMAVGLSLFWASAFWATRKIGPKTWPVVLFLTLAELARAYVFGGFPWGMPSYVLANSFGGQLAAWVGPHGVNLLLFAGAIGAAAVIQSSGRQRYLSATASALVLGVGIFPMTDAPEGDADRPVVRLVQPNVPQHLKWDPEHMGRFFKRSVMFTALGEERPDLIIWPETSVPVLLDRGAPTLAVIAEAAAGVPVVLGINRAQGERVYNSAVLLDGSGSVSQTYDKHHLVPFGEYIPLGNLMSQFGLRGFASRHGDGYSAGPGPRLMDLGPLGKALPLICYEAVFPQDLRGSFERPAFLLQITNDAWFGNFSGPYQHLAQARMRAIEQGLPMVRAANTGVSAVIDAHGRVLAQLGLNEDGFLDVKLPTAAERTLYTRTGDLPLTVLLVILTTGLLMRARRESD